MPIDFGKMNRARELVLRIVHRDENSQTSDLHARHLPGCPFVRKPKMEQPAGCTCGKIYNLRDVVYLAERLALRWDEIAKEQP